MTKISPDKAFQKLNFNVCVHLMFLNRSSLHPRLDLFRVSWSYIYTIQQLEDPELLHH